MFNSSHPARPTSRDPSQSVAPWRGSVLAVQLKSRKETTERLLNDKKMEIKNRPFNFGNLTQTGVFVGLLVSGI